MKHGKATSQAGKTAGASKAPQPRQRLLEAAGEVFATVGFDRALGKDICRARG